MKITEVYVNNFKAYRRCTFRVNSKLNVITGTNNAGKTTILEAISLWYECFRFLISQANRSISNLNLRRGDYRLGNKAQNYVDYREISSVRSYRFEDIFYDHNSSEEIDISLTFCHENEEEKTIGFLIKGANGNNYEIRLKDHDEFDFPWLNRAFRHLPDPIGCYFASPVAAISVGEKFTLDQHVKQKVNARQSFVYIRNRIHRLSSKPTFNQFKESVAYILNGGTSPVDFIIQGDISRDVSINVMISLGNGSREKEISLLGSGTLQIIELLLTSFEEQKDLNIILLDEPDSHIHRDIQRRLVEVFTSRQDATTNQIFITTHNESLIRSVPPDNIFHVDGTVSSEEEITFYPITNQRLPKRKRGISASHYSSILQNLGCESSLDLLNAIEADKLVFVEGADDAEFIQSILDKNNIELRCVYWAFGGLDTLIKKIAHYRDFLNNIGMDESLWSKAVLVIDADFMTAAQKRTLQDRLSQRLQVPCKVWSSYTIESTLLTDTNFFAQLIGNLLQNKGIEFIQQELTQCLSNSINNVINAKLHALNNDELYRRKITGQIQNRANNLEDCLDIDNVITGGEATYFQNFELFARNELQQNRLHHLADKDDVSQIINSVISTLNPEHNEVWGFQDLLDFSTPVHSYPEWTEMVNTLTGV